MTNHTTALRSQAQSILSSIFTQILCEDPGLTFEDFENRSISAVHSLAAAAMGTALECYDQLICSELPDGYRIHDRRSWTMTTEVGDVSFRWRRVKGPSGYSVPLADALDVPWSTRVSPGAAEFLWQAGAEVSYQRAANLLFRKGGSKVSASTVMGVMRRFGNLCEQDDEGWESSLYDLGVVPGGDVEVEEICVEADGVWIPLQEQPEDTPRCVEIEGLVAYSGKTKEGWKVLEVLLDGDKEQAIILLEICRDMGIAREANANRVIGYLRNNLPLYWG